MLFAKAIFLALAHLPIAVWLALPNLASETLTNQAKDLGGVITDIHAQDAQLSEQKNLTFQSQK